MKYLKFSSLQIAIFQSIMTILYLTHVVDDAVGMASVIGYSLFLFIKDYKNKTV